MATYNISFYSVNPTSIFSNQTGSNFVWTGPTDPDGFATITDNEAGAGSLTLDDDSAGNETATADVTIGSVSSTGSTVDAERVWTIRDDVTGEIFEVAQFEVENGDASGFYTMSEIPLVPGRSYTVQDYDNNPNAEAGDIAFAYADYVAADNIVTGTAGGDTLDSTYTGDPEGNQIDSGFGGGTKGMDDSIQGGAAADTITGGFGSDTIDAGDGNDVVYGDLNGTEPAISESLIWTDEGASGTNLSAGFTQNTGDIDVSVSFTNDGNNAPTYEVDTTRPQYVGGGEEFSTTSSLFLFGNGDGATSTTTMDFAASTGAEVANEVENVRFRINDFDWGSGNHTDQMTIQAFNADGVAVDIVITPGGGDTVTGDATSGYSITADTLGENPNDLGGSILFDVAGPVQSIVISYSNGQGGTQGIWLTDVYFDTIPLAAGNDSIDGGAGNDTLYGQDGADTINGDGGNDVLDGGTGADSMDGGLGDDTLYMAEGDTGIGGAGDDLFILTDLGETTGPGAGITIQGDETGEVLGDTLDLAGAADRSTLTFTNTNDAAGGLSGTIQMNDGTLVTFQNIENIICFTPGTRILTPLGERPIETLRPGDLVVTKDDGVQPIRWMGRRTVRAEGKWAPVHLAAGAVPGARRDLIVSPQHRMLVRHWQSELLFGAPEVLVSAKHMINGDTVQQVCGGMVTYVHMVFDRHQIVFAEGAQTESFHIGHIGINALSGASRADLFARLPDLRADPSRYGDTVRPCLRGHEARLIVRGGAQALAA